jgi:hypothetical protein
MTMVLLKLPGKKELLLLAQLMLRVKPGGMYCPVLTRQGIKKSKVILCLYATHMNKHEESEIPHILNVNTGLRLAATLLTVKTGWMGPRDEQIMGKKIVHAATRKRSPPILPVAY